MTTKVTPENRSMTQPVPGANDLPHLLTTTEVAEVLRVSVKTILRRIENGKLPAIREGGRWRCAVWRDLEMARRCGHAPSDSVSLPVILITVTNHIQMCFLVVTLGKVVFNLLNSHLFL